MNYRHAFHAGNFADVLKHVLLIELIEALKAKPAALCCLDTHAGRGLYDLGGDEAGRTGEFRDGIARLENADALPDALERYLGTVRAIRAVHGPARYPGSPLIAARHLREHDAGIVCELQAEEAAALRAVLRGDRRFAVHQRDGYEAMRALLPPKQKRGLVLIDPPFEAQGGEYARIRDALEDAFARWPNAVYAIWYPIKLRETVAPFHRWLAQRADGDLLVVELLPHADHSPLRLNGCGVAIVHPPWQFEAGVRDWLPTLAALLAQGEPTQWSVRTPPSA